MEKFSAEEYNKRLIGKRAFVETEFDSFNGIVEDASATALLVNLGGEMFWADLYNVTKIE